MMYIEIDFSSDEALYMQLRNQIILGIATSRILQGMSLPSVRQSASATSLTTLDLPFEPVTARSLTPRDLSFSTPS